MADSPDYVRLPADLPAPEDDGACAHLVGMALPHMTLAATDGTTVDLAARAGRTVVYCYPRTGRPGEPVPALRGVMTGLAYLVNEHLEHLTIGLQTTRFLRHLERQTFGNAGLHRRAGRCDPGLWSPYAHA